MMMMKLPPCLSTALLLLWSISSSICSAQTTTLPTTDCSVSAYYAEFDGMDDPSEWSREAVTALITRTHEISLPKIATVSGEEGVFEALRDLDAGDSTTEDKPTVHLLFRDIEFDAKLRTPEGWTRGDLWPVDKTADPDTTQAGTDVHAKRCEDWEVERELRGLFWGSCGNHENATYCVNPAVPTQSAPDTYMDFKIKTPPEHLRGDVARSVLYMVLRYGDELGLSVKDCPPFDRTEYGYLSELLEWHQNDPPSQPELDRNTRVCERWQGNRNPLVDFPDLVPAFFGTPDTIPTGTTQYASCTEPTMPPTAAPNACSELLPGDVQVLIWNSNDDDQIVLFPVSQILEEVGSIFVTDQAWDGEQFVGNEGTLEVSIKYLCSCRVWFIFAVVLVTNDCSSFLISVS